MFLKMLSSYSKRLAYLMIAALFSCNSDSPNHSADTVSANQFIQEELKQEIEARSFFLD